MHDRRFPRQEDTSCVFECAGCCRRHSENCRYHGEGIELVQGQERGNRYAVGESWGSVITQKLNLLSFIIFTTFLTSFDKLKLFLPSGVSLNSVESIHCHVWKKNTWTRDTHESRLFRARARVFISRDYTLSRRRSCL